MPYARSLCAAAGVTVAKRSNDILLADEGGASGHAPAPAPRVEYRTFHSASLGADVRCAVSLPPSYDAAMPMPVVVLLHGGFGSGAIPPPGTSGRSDTLPNLSEMAGTALKILDNDPDGFFLLVEEEAIDEAAHANSAPALALAMAEFSAAVQTVLDWVDDPTNAADWSNTLVIVLAEGAARNCWVKVHLPANLVAELRRADPALHCLVRHDLWHGYSSGRPKALRPSGVLRSRMTGTVAWP